MTYLTRLIRAQALTESGKARTQVERRTILWHEGRPRVVPNRGAPK